MEIIALNNATRQNKILKVAAYARVSTLSEEQKTSYDSQVAHFETLIRSNKRWEFAGIYADQGRSGLKAEKRPQFLQMIEDAKAGKIDVILCKSISRFARNSVEAQEYTHLLKEYDVEVRFEREALSTFDAQAEMVFNFLTAVAEEESKSISENTKWTYKKLAEQGIRHLGNNRVLGYDEVEGELVPNEQAWIPKLIFEVYAQGLPLCLIIKLLEINEAKRLKSDKGFNVRALHSMLKNEIYVGDRRIQKQPHTDYKTKRPKKDEEYESFYVSDDHEGIISREVWETVQAKLEQTKEKRADGIHEKRHSHFLYGRFICGECGEPMTRKTHRGQKRVWICKDRKMGSKGNGCKNLIIPEDELLEALSETLGVAWTGVENVDESSFDKLKMVKVFEDGRIEVELREEKKTA